MRNGLSEGPHGPIEADGDASTTATPDADPDALTKAQSAADSEAAASAGVVVGVDIGGTKTALMATDVASGEDLASDRYDTPADVGPEAMVERLEQAVDRLLDAAGRRREGLAAVGIAVPGLVEADQGRVILAGNLAGWQDVPLRDIVCRRFDVPIFVDHDAAAAALGEKWRGGAREMNNFVFLALGTGIGAALMINGRIHRGFHSAAGELGNLVVGREFLGQERNGQGNLAALVGGRAIRGRARQAAGAEISAAETLEQGAGTGTGKRDQRLEPIAEEVADYVAMAVVAIAALLDPEAIIFGGGTADAGADLLDPVRTRVGRELPVRPVLMRAVLGAEAQLHGAVFGALWQLNPDLALREELR